MRRPLSNAVLPPGRSRRANAGSGSNLGGRCGTRRGARIHQEMDVSGSLDVRPRSRFAHVPHGYRRPVLRGSAAVNSAGEAHLNERPVIPTKAMCSSPPAVSRASLALTLFLRRTLLRARCALHRCPPESSGAAELRARCSRTRGRGTLHTVAIGARADFRRTIDQGGAATENSAARLPASGACGIVTVESSNRERRAASAHGEHKSAY